MEMTFDRLFNNISSGSFHQIKQIKPYKKNDRESYLCVARHRGKYKSKTFVTNKKIS